MMTKHLKNGLLAFYYHFPCNICEMLNSRPNTSNLFNLKHCQFSVSCIFLSSPLLLCLLFGRGRSCMLIRAVRQAVINTPINSASTVKSVRRMQPVGSLCEQLSHLSEIIAKHMMNYPRNPTERKRRGLQNPHSKNNL